MDDTDRDGSSPSLSKQLDYVFQETHNLYLEMARSWTEPGDRCTSNEVRRTACDWDVSIVGDNARCRTHHTYSLSAMILCLGATDLSRTLTGKTIAIAIFSIMMPVMVILQDH